MTLFNEQINNWQDWEKLFRSIPAFEPLIKHILTRENLPVTTIENLLPGTNGVFKAGNTVVKIFAPPESEYDQSVDYHTELFATRRAYELGVNAPGLIADGTVDDKYLFNYIITEYIDGITFTDAVKNMTDEEKLAFGEKFREMTDKLNIPCEPFNDIDIINDEDRQWRWDKYPESFRAERVNYINSHAYDNFVFCHGDIGGDNVIISKQGDIYIIDFADAVSAPVYYEHELIAVDMFCFDRALLKGFFGEYPKGSLAEMCFNGLLIHDFGADTIEEHIGKPDEFACLEDLRVKLKKRIENRNK